VATSTGDVSLRLFDLKGSQALAKTDQGQCRSKFDCNRSAWINPNGLYLLQWFDGLTPQQVKLVVNH